MNKKRLKEIRSVAAQLQTCSDALDAIKDAEDAARENTHENFQSGDRYTESENYSDVLSDSVDSINEAIDNLNNIV